MFFVYVSAPTSAFNIHLYVRNIVNISMLYSCTFVHLYNYMYALVCRKSHVANSLLLTFRILPSQLCQQIQIYLNEHLHMHSYVHMQCIDKWITCIGGAAATNGTSFKLAYWSPIIEAPVYSAVVNLIDFSEVFHLTFFLFFCFFFLSTSFVVLSFLVYRHPYIHTIIQIYLVWYCL